MDIPKHTAVKWLMDAVTHRSKRYIEAEDFILSIAEMSLWERVFLIKKILSFMASRDKYNF